jgi:hypothetical protein
MQLQLTFVTFSLLSPPFTVCLSSTTQLLILHRPYSNTNAEMSAGHSKRRRNHSNITGEHMETNQKIKWQELISFNNTVRFSFQSSTPHT